MLDAAIGIRLLFLIGPTLPLPAPVELSLALTKVEVTNDGAGPDGFQLTFSCPRSGPLDYPFLSSDLFATHSRVVLALVFGVLPDVLINGVVTHREFQPGAEPGAGTLTVTGRDATALMEREERNEAYENLPDGLIALRVLARYAADGVVPLASPTADVPLMIDRIPRQAENDLRFLKRMAERNGYAFFLEPTLPGVTQAYWGPPPRGGLPQPALNVQLGSATNVRNISFAGDDHAATGTRGVFVEPFTRMAIPIPALPSLKLPPLAAVPSTPVRTTLLRETANRNASSAAVAAVAAVTNAADPFTAEGELDGIRYGRVLRARKPVFLRGAGWTHDGAWYVRRVTHTIQRGSYSQRFSLSREGQGSLLPAVPPS
jgi:hypothetical protein